MPRFTPMGPGVVPLDERHPLLPESGRRTLDALLEAPDAPRWNHQCGDRLDSARLSRVNAFATSIVTEPPRWTPSRQPRWLRAYVDDVTKLVPRYRAPGTVMASLCTTSRADLAQAWWEMVPDDAQLDDLIWFPTSGSGQAPVVVPTHPVAVSCYYPLLLEAARWHGIAPRFRSDRADWITVASQRQGGFTVASWSSVLGCATAQVNLERSRWRAEDDRQRFLERHDPQVITGDPVSLSDLADLDIRLHPAVLFSTALHLTTATRVRLEERFGCPAVDVYSATESGPIAASRPAGGMALLQPRLYVEIVGSDGATSPPGTPGTVTLTGGMNPYLPLLRYRTGDTARLAWAGDQPLLDGFTGRPIVMLRSAAGEAVSSLDITQLFEELPLRRWTVHQHSDRSVVISVEPAAGASEGLADRIGAAARTALGPVSVSVAALAASDKVMPFTTEEAG